MAGRLAAALRVCAVLRSWDTKTKKKKKHAAYQRGFFAWGSFRWMPSLPPGWFFSALQDSFVSAGLLDGD